MVMIGLWDLKGSTVFYAYFLAVESVKRGDSSPNLSVSLSAKICSLGAAAVEMLEFGSVPAPRGWREGGCPQPQPQPRFPESPDIFTSLLMRAVREQDPCNRAACESTEAPRCLQIWSRYRSEKRELGEAWECMWISSNRGMGKKKPNKTWKIFKQGPFASDAGRGMRREN